MSQDKFKEFCDEWNKVKKIVGVGNDWKILNFISIIDSKLAELRKDEQIFPKVKGQYLDEWINKHIGHDIKIEKGFDDGFCCINLRCEKCKEIYIYDYPYRSYAEVPKQPTQKIDLVNRESFDLTGKLDELITAVNKLNEGRSHE